MTGFVLGPPSRTPGRMAIGVFEVSDANMEVIDSGVLRTDTPVEVTVPGPGRYLVRGFCPPGERFNGILEIHNSPHEHSTLHLRRSMVTTPPSPEGSGWIAVWRPGLPFTPADADAIETSHIGLAVEYTAAAGENVVLQWVVGQDDPRCATVPAGTPVRFVDGQRFEPASDEAHLLLSFLDRGDLTHAAILAEPVLESMPTDTVIAVAAGYYLLSAGDQRLETWSRELTDRWPRLFDAHLLRAWACLYSATTWQQAGKALRDAAQCGLPLAARGLRLLDDALRRVSSVEGRDPEDVRVAFLPYLRAVDGPGLTSFVGWPDAPGTADSAEPPPHARVCYLAAGQLHLAEPKLRVTSQQRPAPERFLGFVRHIFAAPLVFEGARGTAGPSDLDMIVLDLPNEARELLGSALTGRVVREDGQLLIMLAPVPNVPIAIAIDEGPPEWIRAERLSDTIACVRVTWLRKRMPPAVHVAVGGTSQITVAGHLDLVRSRLRAFGETVNFAVVLDQVVLSEVDALLTTVLEQPVDHATWLAAIHAAAWLHWYRFLGSDEHQTSALYLAIELFTIVVREQPDAVPDALRDVLTDAENDPERQASAADQVALQLWTALRTIDTPPLDTAIRQLRETARDQPSHLANLAAALGIRFERLGDRRDLDEAISLMREVVRRSPQNDPRAARTLSNLGAALRTHADLTGEAAVLDEAIVIGERAVASALVDDPHLSGYLSNLAASLQQRLAQRGNLADAHAAIITCHRALQYAADDDLGRPLMWNNLALALRSRFDRTGDLTDLDEAVSASRKAVAEALPGHPNRAATLSNLAMVLRTRFEQRGDDTDADEAISAAREAANLLEVASPARIAVLTNLSTALRTRHRNDHEPNRFDEAISVAAAAVDTANRSGSTQETGPALTALCSALAARYGVTGDLGDLNNAVTAGRAAVSAPNRTVGDRAARLGNLSEVLRLRYIRLGSLADLVEAIDSADAAVSSTDAHDPMRGARLTALSNALMMHASRTLSVPDLNRAVEVTRAAAETLPDGHPDQTTVHSNLGVALRMRYSISRRLDDLEAAIVAGRTATTSTSPQRTVPAVNLAIALRLRSEATNDDSDLLEAVTLCRESLTWLPEFHPSRAPILFNLGKCMMLRYERTGTSDALAAAITAWDSAGRVETAPTATRFEALRVLAQSAAALHLWDTAAAAYTKATALLPVLAWHGIDRAGREDLLTATADVAADAAAAQIAGAVVAEQTLVLLENSRAIIWGQILDIRTDLTELRTRHPDLADRLEKIRTDLDHQIGP